MSNVVLVDFSQTVIAACAANAKDIRDGDTKSFIKHIVFNMLLSWKKKFILTPSDKLILACDAKSYWRKDEFPAYKGHRKHAKKDNSFLDWDLMKEVLKELKEDITLNFPYILLEVEGAEADDIIAILIMYLEENELVQTGLIEESKHAIIISTDGDFQQLQRYPNVSQWNNTEKKFLKCLNPSRYLSEHIASGDTGDNVPNICTPDSWAQARADNIPTRAVSFSKARFDDFYELGINACKNEEEKRNWKRNEMLVDLSKIPSGINTLVIKEYLDYTIVGNKAKVFNFLVKNKMKLLLPYSADF
jgi:hypothetical protein